MELSRLNRRRRREASWLAAISRQPAFVSIRVDSWTQFLSSSPFVLPAFAKASAGKFVVSSFASVQVVSPLRSRRTIQKGVSTTKDTKVTKKKGRSSRPEDRPILAYDPDRR